MKTPIPGDPRELQRALNHPQRRIAVSIHDAVTQRAVIGTYSHRAVEAFTLVNQRAKLFLNPKQFLGVLLFGVFVRSKFLGVGVIPRIDSDHLHPFHRLQCRVGFEMDIRHHRHIGTTLSNARNNLLEIGGVPFGLGCDSNDLATNLYQGHRLLDARFGVQRAAGKHGLAHHRIIAPHHHTTLFGITDHHRPGRTPLIAIR